MIPPAPVSRLPRVGTTIFTTMSALAAEHAAVNLGQGFPDFDCDPALRRELTAAVEAGHSQYAPMAGVLALREVIAAKVEALHGHRYDVEREVTVTAGATQALMAAVLALVHPGDEVVVLEPCYDSYLPAIALAGARAVRVPMVRAGGDPAAAYRPDWPALRAAIGPHTRLLIVNFPHNPTGCTLHDEDRRELAALVERTGVWVLSDEVYEHVVFDGRPHCSVAGLPALAARSVLVSSFGKTLHATGWKIGYACAPAALSAEIRKVHQFMVFAVNTPGQHAVAAYLRDPAPWRELSAFYQARRDLFLQGLAATRFRPLPCEGTYFVLADYAAIGDEPDHEFARTLVVRHGVAAIPLSAFFDDPRQPARQRIVRFCFAKRPATLAAALERLQRV